MRRAIRNCIRLAATVFETAGPILEIGSCYAAGRGELGDLRSFFQGGEYIGCDIRPGPGVDRIEDVHSLSFPEGSVGTVLLLEVLEHLPDPRRAIAEARRVLRPDGVLIVSVPFQYRLHGFPSDYWRFTASGVNVLLSDFADKIVFAAGPRLKPAFIFAVAAKNGSADFAESKSRFRAAVQQAFRRSILRGALSVFKERGRDFFGFLLGRANLTVSFFDPDQKGSYVEVRPRADESQEPAGHERRGS